MRKNHSENLATKQNLSGRSKTAVQRAGYRVLKNTTEQCTTSLRLPEFLAFIASPPPGLRQKIMEIEIQGLVQRTYIVKFRTRERYEGPLI